MSFKFADFVPIVKKFFNASSIEDFVSGYEDGEYDDNRPFHLSVRFDVCDRTGIDGWDLRTGDGKYTRGNNWKLHRSNQHRERAMHDPDHGYHKVAPVIRSWKRRTKAQYRVMWAKRDAERVVQRAEAARLEAVYQSKKDRHQAQECSPVVCMFCQDEKRENLRRYYEERHIRILKLAI